MTCDVATCPRCGIRRYIHPTRSPNLCHSCTSVQTTDEPSHALPPGQWVNHGLIRRWIAQEDYAVPAGQGGLERDPHTPYVDNPFMQTPTKERLEAWK